MSINDDTRLYKYLKKIYHKYIFPKERDIWKNEKGLGFESEASLHMCSLLPKKTIDIIIDYYKPKTWLDVGCGTGTALKYIQKKGISIQGIEYSKMAIKISKIEKQILHHDLTIPLNLHLQFDIVWSYEVAEHLPEQAADEFVSTLVKHGNQIILSAATPGQGGEGHINEQPAQYWIKKLNIHGYEVDEKVTNLIHSLQELYSKNVYCFRRI